ncbi:MAG: adenylate/guanylate cyclase domain-containing protein [Candidatus Riflebacteria bacterium]|nr:adenylate/guanylate cyclase domain-containing protein [Candidatus Riflebacteria bacterium]
MYTQEQSRVLTLRNIFLYFAVVVLPILVGFLALANMVEEQFLAGREIVKQELNLQSARAKLFSTEKYQIQNFASALIKNLDLIKKSPQSIAGFIDRIDKFYPDSCKWLFWDHNGRLLDVPSRHIMHSQRNWQFLITRIMANFRMLDNHKELLNDPAFERQSLGAVNILQKAMGNQKIEHISMALDNPMLLGWLGKPCYVVWNMDVESYRETNVPEKMRGGFMLMLFPEKFVDHFWLNRMIQRRKMPQSGLKHQIVAVDISDRTLISQDPELADKNLDKKLLNAFLERKQSIFEFENYLAKASVADENDPIRIISLANIEQLQQTRKQMLFRLSLVALLLLILLSVALPTVLRTQTLQLSLRMRIALVFAVAMFVPIISLVSIGRSFVVHEESRLKESAMVKMRAGFEALELRYRDAPRLLESSLYKNLRNRLGDQPLTLEKIEAAMKVAVDEGLFMHYIITDGKGRFTLTNWDDIGVQLKKSIEMAAAKIVRADNDIGGHSSVVDAAIDEEIDQYMQSFGSSLDFSRPSQLNFYVFQNSYMYFMSIMVQVDGKVGNLFLHLPDYYLEKHFAYEEFMQNRLAVDSVDSEKRDLPAELFFYSNFKAEKSIPPESPLWRMLKTAFERVGRLKTEESGMISLEDDNYLYAIRPLTSMYTQSFLPCLLTSTRPIEARLDAVKMVISGLAITALLGAIILSLVLAGSLLGSISRIDVAAQQVGRGDLNVALPDMGTDELGRLSHTFNDMVRGLREREKMQAYVSDSVLEAIQDHADESIREGRRVEVTVLFSDIRNFTGLSEKTSPEHVFALLNEFFGGVEPIIRDNNGRVDKFIGDAVMAVFHHTEPEHHTLSAVKAAFAMKAFVDSLAVTSKHVRKSGLEVGVGISTGTVLLGDVGSSRRKDLTVIGDEVNLASRLETASKKGRHSKIIVSGSTWKHIENLVIAEEMPFTEIRGKEQAVQIFELISLKSAVLDPDKA